MVLFSISVQKSHCVQHQNRLSYNFKRADFNHFRDLLDGFLWSHIFANDIWNGFKSLLFEAADQCIPKVTVNSRKSLNWLSYETIGLVRKKRRLYKLAKRTGDESDFHKYRKLSNLVRARTRQDHHIQLNRLQRIYRAINDCFGDG